jgi:hypothetical protein
MAKSVSRRATVHFAALCLITCVLLGSGCSSQPEYGLVEGAVTLDGTALPEVEIAFLPDPNKGSDGPRSAAFTDAQGKYRLKDDRGREGARVGPCRVCIRDIRAVPRGRLLPRGDADDSDRPTAAASPSRVPQKYGDWMNPPFTAEVKPGKQSFDFDVRSNLK